MSADPDVQPIPGVTLPRLSDAHGWTQVTHQEKGADRTNKSGSRKPKAAGGSPHWGAQTQGLTPPSPTRVRPLVRPAQKGGLCSQKGQGRPRRPVGAVGPCPGLR